MKAAEMRQSILQAAVQGKLVPQNIHDEPASELLKRIQKEKAQLVKDGKLKKEKPLPPITEDEIPYDLPEGWVWCRFEGITSLIGDGIHGTPEYDNNGDYYFINGNNLDLSCYRINIHPSTKQVNKEEFTKYKKELNDQSVLLSINGTIGNIAFYNGEKVILGKSAAFINLLKDICKFYIAYFLQSHVAWTYFQANHTGTTIKNLSLGAIRNCLLPLPPLAEQHRIVAKVDELMLLCDELEAAEKELDKLEVNFAEYLPKSILQAGVQGKLVPQNIHDEPASELLKRIQKEKAQLVKDGKLKKEKPLPPITEDEILYDLPEGWVWCRLGEICFLLDGNKKSNIYLPYLEAKVLRGIKSPDEKDNGKYVSKGTKLILVDGENSGEIFTAHVDGYMGSTFKILNIIQTLWIPYILIFIQLHKDILRDSKKGAAIPHLNKELFFNLALPLPPLAEQQRIVAKVDELMALCDELKAARTFTTAPNVIPFPEQVEEEELLMVAQGEVSGKVSKELKQAQKDLFEDGANG